MQANPTNWMTLVQRDPNYATQYSFTISAAFTNYPS